MDKVSRIFLVLIFGLLYANVLLAGDKDTHCYWDKNEVQKYNVLRDIKEGRGRIWYVDGKNGDDNNSGTSLESAFKTIGKAFDYYAHRPAPGDIVVIKAGVYKERVWIRSQGTKDNPIVVGPYGDGEVIIDASNKIGNWEKYKKNIYKASCPFKPTAVVVDDKPLFPEFSLEKLGEGEWYYDKDTESLYLYFTAGDPSLHDIGVIEDDKYKPGVFLNHAKYVILYGLTVKYAGGHGISVLGDYNRIEKCNVEFNGRAGIRVWTWKDTMSRGNILVGNRVYHNMLRNWPRGRYKHGGWNVGLGAASPDVQIVGNLVYKNGGEGIWVGGNKEGGAIISNNIVYDNWSVNIYVDNYPNVIIERNFIFSHNPDPGDLRNNGDKNPSDGKNFRRLRPEGIMTADESSPAHCKDIKITNNIIVGCRRGITHYGRAKNSGMKNVLIAHNTIILPDKKGLGEKFIGIRIPYNNGNNANVVVRNNIVYGINPDSYLLSVDYDPSKFDDFGGLTFDHNLWYNPNSRCTFHVGSRWLGDYDMGFNEWKNKCNKYGQAKGSKFADPKFVNVGGYTLKGLKLKVDSPAVDSGIPVEGVITDYYGNIRDNNPDIGAIEFIFHVHPTGLHRSIKDKNEG